MFIYSFYIDRNYSTAMVNNNCNSLNACFWSTLTTAFRNNYGIGGLMNPQSYLNPNNKNNFMIT